MKIQKLLHSCLLVEDSGVRILIDPGDYSFAEKLFIPESLSPIDAVLITHNHSDHCSIDALRRIAPKKIFGSAATQATLAAAGIISEVIMPGGVVNIGGVAVRGIRAPHDPRLGAAPPESVGFIVGDVLLHPGDSFDFDASLSYRVLALPVAAPWMVRKEAVDLGLRLKPAHVIPIHDGMFKTFAADANTALFTKLFGQQGIVVHPLRPGEALEI